MPQQEFQLLRRNWLLPFGLLASWASTGCALGRSDLVPISVGGMNYTGDDISYMLFDPNDAEKKVTASEELRDKQVGLATAYSRFSGSDDPALLEFERDRREASLKYSQNKVDRLLKTKP